MCLWEVASTGVCLRHHLGSSHVFLSYKYYPYFYIFWITCKSFGSKFVSHEFKKLIKIPSLFGAVGDIIGNLERKDRNGFKNLHTHLQCVEG